MAALQHSALLSILTPQENWNPALTDMNRPLGGANMVSIMAFSSGDMSSSVGLPPQHSTVPSRRRAQEWRYPALIWEKLPEGESISPVVSVRRSASPLAPQQMMLPSARSPQVW